MTLLQAIEHWQTDTMEFYLGWTILIAGAAWAALRLLDERTKPEHDKDRL